MARGLEDIAALPDPLARTLAEWTRPNGLRFRRIAAPLGVIGMIYESRPNVGADAAGLCLKSGNAVILRGGSESLHSARAIHAAMAAGLAEPDCPAPPCRSRRTRPRLRRGHAGGAGAARPHHPARRQVPGGAGAARGAGARAGACRGHEPHLRPRRRRPVDGAARCWPTASCAAPACAAPPRRCCWTPPRAALLPPDRRPSPPSAAASAPTRAPRRSCRTCPPPIRADFDTEWLDAVLNVAMVDGVDGALAHIARHGSEHTDAIVTADEAAAEHFLAGVSSAVALWNASTQFCDGGEFGFGGEIGIATGRLHARGPVGARAAYHLPLRGDGHGPGAALSRRAGVRPGRRASAIATGCGWVCSGGRSTRRMPGHRHVAMLALRRLRLDQVWLLVSPGNPLKPRAGHGAVGRAPRRGPRDRRRTPGAGHRDRADPRHPLHRRYAAGAAAAVSTGALRLADGGGHPGRTAALAALDGLCAPCRSPWSRAPATTTAPWPARRRTAAPGARPARGGRLSGRDGAAGMDLPAGAPECHIRNGFARGILAAAARKCGSRTIARKPTRTRRQAACQAPAAEARDGAGRGRQGARHAAQEGRRRRPEAAGRRASRRPSRPCWTGSRRRSSRAWRRTRRRRSSCWTWQGAPPSPTAW